MRNQKWSGKRLAAAIAIFGVALASSSCSTEPDNTTPPSLADVCSDQFLQWATATYGLDEGVSDPVTLGQIPHYHGLPPEDCTFRSRPGGADSEVLLVWVSSSVGEFDSLARAIRDAALKDGYTIAVETNELQNLVLDSDTTTRRQLVTELLGPDSPRLNERGLKEAKSVLLVRFVKKD